MKLMLLISTLFILDSSGDSIGFGLLGSSTNYINISVKEKIDKSEFTMKNHSEEPLNLVWKKKSNTLVKGWTYSVCAFGECSIGVPDSGVFETVQSNETAFFALHLFPHGNIGEGNLEIEVYDRNFPELKKLLIFEVVVHD